MDVEKYESLLKIVEDGQVIKEKVVEMDIEKWNLLLKSLKDKPTYDYSNKYSPSRAVNELIVFASPDKYPKLLCIGCGSGYEVEYAIAKGYKAQGVTLGQKNVEVAKARGLDVRHGDMHDLQFPPDSFDVALCNHSFEHAFNGWMVAIEVYAVLRDYGRWLVEVPVQHVGLKESLHPWHVAYDLNHMNLLIPEEMERIFLHTGFKTVKSEATKEKYAFCLEKVPIEELKKQLGEATLNKIVWIIPILNSRIAYGAKKYTENYQWVSPFPKREG